MEPRGCLAEHDAATGRFTLTTPSQGVVSLRTALAGCLGIPAERLRVLTHDVGGSFAAKIWPYPEHVLALVAAPRHRAAGALDGLADAMPSSATCRAGRGSTARRLALDAEGRFLAFRIEALADMGAFLNTAAPSIVTQGAVRPFAQLYRIPGQHYRVEAIFTNAHPTDAYRGAGKPETTATLERLIDVAARDLGIDPLGLRERNLIRPDELPLTTPMGEAMDAGDFPGHRRAPSARPPTGPGLAARKSESEARGPAARGLDRLSPARDGRFDGRALGGARLPDGTVLVRSGAQDSGQGHRATLALVAAEALDLPPDRIRVEQGDSDWLGGRRRHVAART